MTGQARKNQRAAARKRPSKREADLRRKKAEVEAHLESLGAHAIKIQRAARANERAQDQMLGRLRGILEDLGEAPPLEPPAPPPEVTEPPEGEPEGVEPAPE